jgi:hypothetical protein
MLSQHLIYCVFLFVTLLTTAHSFKELSVGAHSVCALTNANTLRCWGDMPGVPGGNNFVQVSNGFLNACAVKSDKSVACFGSNFYPLYPPSGIEFTQVKVSVATYNRACGITTSKKVVCWGGGYPPELASLENVEQLEFLEQGVCILDSANKVTCVGAESSVMDNVPKDTEFVSIIAATSDVCGIRKADSKVQCWGSHHYEIPDTYNYSQISLGGNYLCGLDPNTTSVTCTKTFTPVTSMTLPSKNSDYVQVSGENFCQCGIKDQSISCFCSHDEGFPSKACETNYIVDESGEDCISIAVLCLPTIANCSVCKSATECAKCSDTDYIGDNCDIPKCFDNQCDEKYDRGICVAPGECICEENYVGEDCSILFCYANCSVCGSATECAVCNDTRYTGYTCDVPICFENQCNEEFGAGKCIAPGICECSDRVSGEDCSEFTCFGKNASDACYRGDCVAPDFCLCYDDEIFGDECDKWYCGDVLNTEAYVCAGRGRCRTSGDCACDDGTQGANCTDVVMASSLSTSETVLVSSNVVDSKVDESWIIEASPSFDFNGDSQQQHQSSGNSENSDSTLTINSSQVPTKSSQVLSSVNTQQPSDRVEVSFANSLNLNAMYQVVLFVVVCYFIMNQ